MSQPVKTLPTVSAIIPAYNAAGFILGAINSVLNQSFTSHEIIIINDGSPDTDELERKLQPYLANIQYIKQENQGAAAARNTGLRAARGEYVAFLDADDIAFARFSHPPLTTVRIPRDALGRVAFESLERMIHNKRRTGVERVVAAQLVIRQSTGAARKI